MRYIQAARAAAHLTRNGVFVYSPIAHSHPLAVHGGLSGSWDFWQRVARQWVERCDRLVVLKLDGWLESVGVQAEIEHARSLGKPVEYLEP